MKKWGKVLLLLLLAVILAAGALCWWQWDNISALRLSVSTSREDLSQKMEENDRRVDDVSEKLPVTVRDLTEEEKVALRDESLSREELLDRLTGKETPAESTGSEGETVQPDQTQESPQDTQETEPEKGEDRLSRLIAEIYLMKTEYTAWLEEAYEDCIGEYNALPEEERTTAAKYSLGMKYMKTALAKEDECDLKMETLLDEIAGALAELGEDTSLVEEIRSAYEEEKALKKAYYLGLHG